MNKIKFKVETIWQKSRLVYPLRNAGGETDIHRPENGVHQVVTLSPVIATQDDPAFLVSGGKIDLAFADAESVKSFEVGQVYTLDLILATAARAGEKEST